MPTKPKLLCLAVGLVLALQTLPGCSRVIGLGSEYYIAEGGTAGLSAGNGGAGATGEGAGGSGDAGGTGGLSAGSGGLGSGGDAGAPTTDNMLCQMYPIPARATWVPTASSHGPNDPIADLTDNTPARWSTGKPQAGDEWLQIDFGKTVAIRTVNLQQGGDPNDYPRMFSIAISDTKTDLAGPALFAGEGTAGVTTTTNLSQPHAGRYLLIKQLGVSLSWWSVDELEVGCTDD